MLLKCLLIESNAGIPTALCQKSLWVVHLQNLAKRLPLVRRMLVICLGDAVSNPIAEVALFVQGAVIEPLRKIGLAFVGDECRLDFLFVTLRTRFQARAGDAARNKFGGELRCAFN